MTLPKKKAEAKATAEEEATEQQFLAKQADKPSQKSENVYNYTMSSTVEAPCVDDDFWRLKLIS